MRDPEGWQPSKYILADGRLVPTKDARQLSVASRLIAQLTADFYSEALPAHAHGRLLDLGCGPVPFYGLYRPLVSDNICVDWANTLHPNRHLDVECDLSGTLPFPDGSFDTILLSDVLEHLPDPMHTWREMARLLAPGGKLILNAPFFYQIHEAPHDYYRYTEFMLRRFADAAGFEVVELRAIGGAVEILADVLSKLMMGWPKGRWFAALVQRAAGWFVRTRTGARLMKSTSPRFPFGYAMVTTRREDK